MSAGILILDSNFAGMTKRGRLSSNRCSAGSSAALHLAARFCVRNDTGAFFYVDLAVGLGIIFAKISIIITITRVQG